MFLGKKNHKKIVRNWWPCFNKWPENPSIFRELELAAKRLTEFFIEHSSRLRLNLFPPCPSPVLAFGVGSHKDGGALTVLAQDDVGGLNVKRKVDGQRDDPTYLVVANGRSLASYGIIAVCTHLGCVLPWIAAGKKNFICPCHGSQFYQGKVRDLRPAALAGGISAVSG
ncbi:hypothetical protein ACLOJK_033377 [Asimina triloba]